MAVLSVILHNVVELIVGAGKGGLASSTGSKGKLIVLFLGSFKANGVDEIVCVSVNDAFVMNEWKQDQMTLSAVRCLEELLQSDSPAIFHHRLSAGQGLICNNILHTRSAFEDDEGGLGRLVYRARFSERIV